VKKNLLIVAAVVVFILTLDQLIKIWIKTTFTVYDEPVNILGDWFRLYYTENQGMAFGTTFGSSMWAKLSLSLFRVVAIGGIAYYWYKQAKEGAKLEFLIAVGLVFSGALGNLIDSMFYDFFFTLDPCLSFNHLEGSGIQGTCGMEVRHTGFLFGNVVDMFQFNATWPSWVPWLGGGDVFPAIWNVADASITLGVILILIRQRTYFPKKKEEDKKEDTKEEMQFNETTDVSEA
jgi:signal peptidase II